MSEQPQVITLNNVNSIELLNQFIDHAQKNGTFALPEADILKRCRDVLLRGQIDSEIPTKAARNLFIQAVNKGQSKGCYTLDDASMLHKICQYVSSHLDDPLPEVQQVPLETPQQTDQVPLQESQLQEPSVQEPLIHHQSNPNISELNDLDELSAPIPLRSSGPRVI
jgi:hypothetical protein